MKILYVTTISNTVNAFLIPHIKMLIDKGHRVDIAFNIEQEVNPEIAKMRCRVHAIEFQRSILTKQNYLAYKKLKKLIQDEKYDLVHTHTPVASACVRIACRKIKNVKVIYTAHGFHFFKGAPLINWLLYYPAEYLLSRYTDVLITINKEDYARAKRFRAKKVEYIPGAGIDIKRFNEMVVDKSEKRRELGVPKDAFVILSVGELNKNKNHKTVIKAIANINNPKIYYIICGQGPLDSYLKKLVKKLGLEKQVKLLGYRSDTAEILKISDVFVFPSKREGLGLAALEAMASGLPIITSNVHGIVDYSLDHITGYTCSPTDVSGFSISIRSLLENVEIREQMSNYNIAAVRKFNLESVIGYIEEIYN